MFNDADVQRLVGSVYAAAYDETRWSVCFTGLTRALNATTAGFICVSPGATHSATSLFTGIEEQGIGDYAAHFVARNVWVAPAQVMRPGDVFPDRALYPRRDLRKTEFYNDYLRRYDIASAIGGCISNDEIKSFVSLMRPERLGDWPAWCEQLLGLLLPHLRCAVTIHRELSLAQQQRVVGYELLDALKVPTLVVNRDQKVIVANSAGNRVLNARDGLLDRGGRLDASHRDDGVELSRLIRAALRSETTPWEAAPQWINLRRPSLRRALRVCAAPPPNR